MKFRFTLLLSTLLFVITSCNNKKVPDVSHIKINLQIERFEQDFFKADTNNLSKYFDSLNAKYGSFLGEYLYKILGLPTNVDTAIVQAKLFLTDSLYKQAFKDICIEFSDFNESEKQINQGLKLCKYYFPQCKVPNRIITYLGPLDGINVFTNREGVMEIALLAYMGKNYNVYQLDYIQQAFPAYKLRRFEKRYIPFDCIKDLVNRMYPDETKGRPLIERMIENGRRLFVLDALLPNTADTIKTGYTQAQLKGCIKNEEVIWSYFVQHNLLYEREPSIVTPYVTDGPKTPEISEAAPGNIGQFVGWQIVKKWMQKNDGKTLRQLMETPVMTIFNEANYAP